MKWFRRPPEERPGGGSGTCSVDLPEKQSDYFRRDPGFRLFGYIFIGAPQRRAKPRERQVTLILYDSSPMIQEKQDGSAAPEWLPAGGSRTWLCRSFGETI
jgi:hypothetical protein